jgi:hypothetical protein
LNQYGFVGNDPINAVDPTGLWPTGAYGSPEVHQAAIDRVLPFLSGRDRDILKNQQVVADTDQSPAGAYRHGMRHPFQTADQARAMANQYVRGEINAARCLEAKGLHDEALERLGNAIHALGDSTSPMHNGFQVWGGASGAGDYLGNKQKRKETNWHVQGEGYDPGAGSRLDWATRRAYQYFRGTRQMPADVFHSGEF